MISFCGVCSMYSHSVQIGATEQSTGRVGKLSDLGSSHKSQTRILSTMSSLVCMCLFSGSEGERNNYFFICKLGE